MLCYYLRITGRGPLALVLTLGGPGWPGAEGTLRKGKEKHTLQAGEELGHGVTSLWKVGRQR